MILKKAIVNDFSKNLLSLNSLEMNKLTMNGEILSFRPSLQTPDASPVVTSLPSKTCKHIHRTRPCEKSRELVP